MARCEVRGQHQIAQTQTLPICHRARHVHWREYESVGVLRIVVSSPFEQRHIRSARNHLGTSVVRELSYAAGVITVRMRIENPSDVARIDAQRSNTRLDQRCVHRYAAVDQNVAGRCGDEKDAQAAGPDVPGVAIDAQRFLRSGPRGIVHT